jgi:thiol-disulfide isomerase/thioredoxin
MMIERLVLTLLIVALAAAAWWWFRRWHAGRVARLGLSGPADQPAILYFRSDHCRPCDTQSFYLEQLAELFAGRLQIRSIDAEREAELAEAYGIFTLPTTVVVDTMGRVRHVNYGLTMADKLARQLAGASQMESNHVNA